MAIKLHPINFITKCEKLKTINQAFGSFVGITDLIKDIKQKFLNMKMILISKLLDKIIIDQQTRFYTQDIKSQLYHDVSCLIPIYDFQLDHQWLNLLWQMKPNGI